MRQTMLAPAPDSLPEDAVKVFFSGIGWCWICDGEILEVCQDPD